MPSAMTRLLAPLAAGMLAMLVACTPPRASALRVLDEMEAATQSMEKAHESLVRDLLVHDFTQLKARLEAQRCARIAEAECEIYRLTEQRNQELSRESVGQLTAALGPVLQQMKKALTDEQDKLRTGQGGSRARELELASQYSSTLAVSTHEAEKIREEIDTQLRNAREEAIGELRKEGKSGEAPLDPEKEADALVQKLKAEAETDSYLAGMKKGYEELRDYVKLESPAHLILRGLLGEKLGSRLGVMLEAKAGQLEGKYFGKVQEALGSLQKKYEIALKGKK